MLFHFNRQHARSIYVGTSVNRGVDFEVFALQGGTRWAWMSRHRLLHAKFSQKNLKSTQFRRHLFGDCYKFLGYVDPGGQLNALLIVKIWMNSLKEWGVMGVKVRGGVPPKV